MVIFYGQADFRVQNVAKLRNKLKRSITRQASYSNKDCSIQPAAAWIACANFRDQPLRFAVCEALLPGSAAAPS
jgi:hypothetical protein